MNPKLLCPCPPEPPVQDAGPVRWQTPSIASARRFALYTSPLSFTPLSFLAVLDPLLVLQLLLLGLCGGFLAGLLGIGGGMVLVPFLTVIVAKQGVEADLAVKMAIATGMATIVFTSLSSVRAHHLRGAVRWDIWRRFVPGIVLGAALASLGVFAALNGQTLALVFALFVAFSATQMWLDQKPAASRTLPGPAGQLAAGGGIGFVSGLVGAGGGFISVPLLVWCNVAMHQAVATSAALGFPIALANSIGYALAGHNTPGLPAASLGYIFLPALLVIALASVLGAPLGARAAHALPVRPLKRLFALVLYALAAFMLYQGLSG